LTQQSFLKTVAQQIGTRFNKQLHQVAIVFPNRRQSVFFKKYLIETIAAPAFLPELLTVEELVQRSSAYTVADKLVQSFALYEAYSNAMFQNGGDNILTYEKFYPIGDILLRDFQELDANLADVALVFRSLKDLEEIEKAFEQLSDEQKVFLQNFWGSFSSSHKSIQQQKFLQLWEMLPDIYENCHNLLQGQQFTTIGMAYRQLANGKPSRPNFAEGWKHIAFVGFNAFNKSEEKLLAQWQKEGKSTLWMDVDAHYVKNMQHEAGHFIRRNLQELGLKNELPLLQNIAASHMPMQVIAAQGAVAQAKVLPEWLASTEISNKEYEIRNKEFASPIDGRQPIRRGNKIDTDLKSQISNLKSAAIILADEGLLVPVLQSLPKNVGKINVTMGYPMQQTPLFSFIQLFFAIQQNLASHQFQAVSFEQVQAFLQHPLCDWPYAARQQLQQDIIKQVMLQVPLHLLQNHSSVGNFLFSPIQKPIQIFERLGRCMEEFSIQENTLKDPLLQGLVLQCWQTIQQLQQLFATMPTDGLSLSFIAQSVRKQLAGISVPFEGEPLEGIQVMGLLESRGLDFDHIIIIGANEGSLPRLQSPSSFLPDSIRRAFGLSVAEHQDAIFAYAFYRLLHRCQNMTLVYNAVINDQSTGEVTRFLPQLEYEATNLPITKTTLNFTLKGDAAAPITIEKTPEVLKQFNAYFLPDKPKPISPTQLNSYLHCRLQYYFRYIAKLEAPKQMEDEVDAAIFGKVVHKIMELLYQNLVQFNGHKNITTEGIAWMREKIPVLLPQAFAEGWHGNSKKKMEFSGRLLVVAEVVKQYANAYLDYDAANVPFVVEQLEIKLNQPFAITLQGRQRNVWFNGIIDRLDLVNGIHRMVDYKTGADDTEFATIEKLFDREGKKMNKAALQTLMYAWIFNRTFPEKEKFEPALLPMRKMQEQKERFSAQLISKPNRGELLPINAENILQHLHQLEDHLKIVLEELFDATIPFNQTGQLERCTYCDFVDICGRN
jgi:hypothetical protein